MSRYKELNSLTKAVTRLVAAEIASEWAGAGDPDDVDAVEQELVKAKSSYNLRVLRLRQRISALHDAKGVL